MTKVKICGLKRLEDIAYVNELKPDYAGFVFAGSKRQVDKETAAVLREAMDRQIPAVGVFVDEPLENVLDLADKKIIDMIQLHGHEDLEYIMALKERCDCPVIKAVVVHSKEDIENSRTLPVEYLLFDGGRGDGQPFAWSLMKQKIEQPFFLAGGIGIENIDEAIETVQPFAVDVSSGVETDGFKDREKIRELIRRVRDER